MDIIDKYKWPALAWFGAFALVVMIGWWTANRHEYLMRCMEIGGTAINNPPSCKLQSK